MPITRTISTPFLFLIRGRNAPSWDFDYVLVFLAHALREISMSPRYHKLKWAEDPVVETRVDGFFEKVKHLNP